jgi:DNA primase
LIEEDFTGFADIELPNAALQGLHSAILSVLTLADLSEGGGLGQLLTGSGQGSTLEMLAALVARSKLWVAMPDAAVEDVREAWRQALHLHHLTRNLGKELRFAESALAAEANDENFERLLDIRAQMNNAAATEALLDGFGVMSGRVASKFSN